MFGRLIHFKTVSPDGNLGLIEWVRDYLQGLGAVTRLTHDATGEKAHLFATLGASQKPGPILSGYTDVVPVDGPNWDTDPCVGVERDGKLFARGSAVMKGFIGIILARARAPKFVAALNDRRLDAPLHYSLSHDEEAAGLGVRGPICDLEENNIRPAGCVVREPTSMQPIVALKSPHRFRCSVHGREAHSSYVTHGVNAIEYAARLVVFIRQTADRLAQIERRDYAFRVPVPYSTLSTAVIHGGIAATVVPPGCVFSVDVCTLPQTAPDALYQEIRPYAAGLAQEMRTVDENSGINLEWSNQAVGLQASETDAIVHWALQLSRSTTVGKVWCGPEAGLFQIMGVRTVICRPGDIAQAHRPNAYVALDQLVQCERFIDRIRDRGYAK